MSPVSSRDGRLHAAMAGRGNPYVTLTPERLPLVQALSGGQSVAAISAAFGLTPDAVAADLAALAAAGLIVAGPTGPAPSFVVADAGEVRRVALHARRVGERLAEGLWSRWNIIEAALGGRAGLAFFLVGDRILDVGLLDALAADGRLLPPAPPRPAPSDPDAHYYLWMVEGERSDLGRYGQRVTPLPWPGWELLTFGLYLHDGDAGGTRSTPASGGSPSRAELEAAAFRLARERPEPGPAALAAALDVPRVEWATTAAWERVAGQIADELVAVYLKEEASLRRLWTTLRASSSLPESFPEFFCWYDHLAYAHAIDALVELGAFTAPADGYCAVLWEPPDTVGAF